MKWTEKEIKDTLKGLAKQSGLKLKTETQIKNDKDKKDSNKNGDDSCQKLKL